MTSSVSLKMYSHCNVPCISSFLYHVENLFSFVLDGVFENVFVYFLMLIRPGGYAFLRSGFKNTYIKNKTNFLVKLIFLEKNDQLSIPGSIWVFAGKLPKYYLIVVARNYTKHRKGHLSE